MMVTVMDPVKVYNWITEIEGLKYIYEREKNIDRKANYIIIETV